MMRSAFVAFALFALALPAFSGTHKENLPNACTEVWTAVKDTLSNQENYTIKISDEAHMTANYGVKHSVHISLGGALRQRTNTVSLSQTNDGCQMEVKSNYSGIEHNDAGEFIKRVKESLAKQKETPASEPAKPAETK
jgi:hypothetical protein